MTWFHKHSSSPLLQTASHLERDETVLVLPIDDAFSISYIGASSLSDNGERHLQGSLFALVATSAPQSQKRNSFRNNPRHVLCDIFGHIKSNILDPIQTHKCNNYTNVVRRNPLLSRQRCNFEVLMCQIL